MDSHLMFKITHMTFASVAIVVFLLRALQLVMASRNGSISGSVPRSVPLIALQHLSYSLLIVTGIILLYQKHFMVQHWFYAKIILFVVVLSASAKAFGQRELDWQQRKAGVFVAGIALAGLLTLIMVKPNFGDTASVTTTASVPHIASIPHVISSSTVQ